MADTEPKPPEKGKGAGKKIAGLPRNVVIFGAVGIAAALGWFWYKSKQSAAASTAASSSTPSDQCYDNNGNQIPCQDTSSDAATLAAIEQQLAGLQGGSGAGGGDGSGGYYGYPPATSSTGTTTPAATGSAYTQTLPGGATVTSPSTTPPPLGNVGAGYVEHTAESKKGDTLAAIATRNKNSVSTVDSLNPSLYSKYGNSKVLPTGTQVTLPYAT